MTGPFLPASLTQAHLPHGVENKALFSSGNQKTTIIPTEPQETLRFGSRVPTHPTARLGSLRASFPPARMGRWGPSRGPCPGLQAMRQPPFPSPHQETTPSVPTAPHPRSSFSDGPERCWQRDDTGAPPKPPRALDFRSFAGTGRVGSSSPQQSPEVLAWVWRAQGRPGDTCQEPPPGGSCMAERGGSEEASSECAAVSTHADCAVATAPNTLSLASSPNVH